MLMNLVEELIIVIIKILLFIQNWCLLACCCFIKAIKQLRLCVSEHVLDELSVIIQDDSKYV